MKIKMTFKIWLLIVVVILSLISIFSIPPIALEKGVIVTSVKANSAIFADGLRVSMIIQKINGHEIRTPEDYLSAMAPFKNLSENETKKLSMTTNKIPIINLFTKNVTDDISVGKSPLTRIQTGLDLRGGARAFVKADIPLSDSQLNDLIAISEQRLNVYGLSDTKFIKVKKSDGENLMEVVIAGASPNNLEELIAKQGKFEAKIGNQTVFIGGHKDITYEIGRAHV